MFVVDVLAFPGTCRLLSIHLFGYLSSFFFAFFNSLHASSRHHKISDGVISIESRTSVSFGSPGEQRPLYRSASPTSTQQRDSTLSSVPTLGSLNLLQFFPLPPLSLTPDRPQRPIRTVPHSLDVSEESKAYVFSRSSLHFATSDHPFHFRFKVKSSKSWR